MNLTKIFSIVFLAIAIGLGYYLFSRVSIKIEEDNRIARIERQVIEKLKMIRDAQVAYQAIHGRYTTDWDQLISFIDTGKIYIVQRREHIQTLSYGRDSVWVETDTLGSVLVRDSLFSRTRYPNFNLERLPYIPGSDNKRFDIFADEIIRGGVGVDVIEVRDVDPVNPARSESHPAFSRKPLRFGSRTEVSTSGNWE
jgi:hypothetical protein